MNIPSEYDIWFLFSEEAPIHDIDPDEGWELDEMIKYLNQWGYVWMGYAWIEVRNIWMKYPEDRMG